MSNKQRPQQYTDPRASICEGFDGNIIQAEGPVVPVDTTPGYAPWCIFWKRSGTVGAQGYINQGTVLSSAFVAVPDLTGISSVANALAGLSAGKKVVGGVTALDGSNPTPVVTGLTTVISAVVSLENGSAPGVGTSVLTQAQTNWATGALSVLAWKVTSSIDNTLVASTGTENFQWVAYGT